MTRSEYVWSSLVEKTTSRTMVTAATINAASSAHQKESTVKLSRMSPARRRTKAFIASTSRKPSASMNGSRSAARIGGRSAFSTATTIATMNAPPLSAMSTPGRMAAAAAMESAVTTQAIRKRRGLNRS